MAAVPTWRVPRVKAGVPIAWEAVPDRWLCRSQDGGEPEQATRVRVAWSEWALHVRFACADRDAWGTFTQRDDPLWQEEAVEVFLAPGEAAPRAYAELEVSPAGVLFDAWIENPDSLRATMRTRVEWDCPGVAWEVGRTGGAGGSRQDWWAELALPWAGLLAGDAAVEALPRAWRANFYRIERPRDGEAELSAWSPTLVDPADFHQPGRFGVLQLEG